MFAEQSTMTPISPWAIALFAFLSAQCALLIPLWYSSRNKVLDWKRQDEVAKRVHETHMQTAAAAQLLLDRQALDSLKTAEAARLLLAANERVAKNSGEMNGKLDVIHDLVNSKMTEAMQGQLNEAERGLASLKEIVDLKLASGKEPSKEALGAIKATEERISEMKAQLEDRLQQQAAIDIRKQASFEAEKK